MTAIDYNKINRIYQCRQCSSTKENCLNKLYWQNNTCFMLTLMPCSRNVVSVWTTFDAISSEVGGSSNDVTDIATSWNVTSGWASASATWQSVYVWLASSAVEISVAVKWFISSVVDISDIGPSLPSTTSDLSCADILPVMAGGGNSGIKQRMVSSEQVSKDQVNSPFLMQTTVWEETSSVSYIKN